MGEFACGGGLLGLPLDVIVVGSIWIGGVVGVVVVVGGGHVIVSIVSRSSVVVTIITIIGFKVFAKTEGSSRGGGDIVFRGSIKLEDWCR